jgi:HEAT repeat protein
MQTPHPADAAINPDPKSHFVGMGALIADSADWDTFTSEWSAALSKAGVKGCPDSSCANLQQTCTVSRPYNTQMAPAQSLATHSILKILVAISVWAGSALAQENPPNAAAGNGSQSAPASAASTVAQTAAETPAETIKKCWQSLTDSVQDAKHTEIRTQALNALTSLGWSKRADGLIAAAMMDPDLDVRTAAILAAGKTKSHSLIEPVRKLLDDAEPQVVFAAARTLWKQFADKSGEDILAAITAGDRKANPSLIHGAEHDISRTLHSSSALEKIALVTGAGLVLGPFGFSVSAVEYARKNGADSARIQAIDLLAEDKTEGVRDEMKSALDDKDPGVRAAAVKVLGNFHRSEDSKAIATLLNDPKLPVRLAAAAAYIDCLSRSAKTGAPHR